MTKSGSHTRKTRSTERDSRLQTARQLARELVDGRFKRLMDDVVEFVDYDRAGSGTLQKWNALLDAVAGAKRNAEVDVIARERASFFLGIEVGRRIGGVR